MHRSSVPSVELPSERSVAASQHNSSNVLNLTNQNLRKISLPQDISDRAVKKLILDRNQIIKVENLEPLSEFLEQLSVASNRLVRLIGLSTLVNLKVLNVPHNSIAVIEGLNNLKNLVWLNLSNNNIKTLDGISCNASLTYLDVSHNNLTTLSPDVKTLSHLKSLMLQGNLISSLSSVPQCLPMSIVSLSLGENEISDLCHFCYLSSLPRLEQLSVQKNPCVEFCLDKLEYRPYIVNWCLSVSLLDSSPVTNRESLKAEWLYTQGKGRKFRPGEMNALVDYLKTHCPLTSSDDTSANTDVSGRDHVTSDSSGVVLHDEDVRLSRVLNKQLQYQKEKEREKQMRVAGGGINASGSSVDSGRGDRLTPRVDSDSNRNLVSGYSSSSGSNKVRSGGVGDGVDFSTLSMSPFARNQWTPVRNDDSLQKQKNENLDATTTRQNSREPVVQQNASSTAHDSDSDSFGRSRPTPFSKEGLRGNFETTEGRKRMSNIDRSPDARISRQQLELTIDEDPASSLLVSSSFLLPALSPPALLTNQHPPIGINDNSEKNNAVEHRRRVTAFDATSNLDDVSFSEMMPGTDHFPPSPTNDQIESDSDHFVDVISIKPPSPTNVPRIENRTQNFENLHTAARSSQRISVQEVTSNRAVNVPVPELLINEGRKTSKPQESYNLNANSILLLNRCATVIQATWRGYHCRKTHATDTRSIKSMAKLRAQVEALAEEVEQNKAFQSLVMQILAQLISKQQTRPLLNGLDSCNSTQQSLREDAVKNDVSLVPNERMAQNSNSQPGLRDTITELRNEFSRMSAQFVSDSNAVESSHLISEAADPNNDTSTSSLRVVSLTEEDMISQWGVDGCHDNEGTGTDCDEDLNETDDHEGDNVNDSTFTESEQVDLLSSSALMSPTAVSAPTGVRVKIRDGNALLVSWKHSDNHTNPTTATNYAVNSLGHPIVSVLSYKIVVDRVPRGVVSANKTNAIIQGLDVNNQQYSVTVRAVTALGESADSFPAVKAGFASPLQGTHIDAVSSIAKHTLLQYKSSSWLDEESEDIERSKDLKTEYQEKKTNEVVAPENINDMHCINYETRQTLFEGDLRDTHQQVCTVDYPDNMNRKIDQQKIAERNSPIEIASCFDKAASDYEPKSEVLKAEATVKDSQTENQTSRIIENASKNYCDDLESLKFASLLQNKNVIEGEDLSLSVSLAYDFDLKLIKSVYWLINGRHVDNFCDRFEQVRGTNCRCFELRVKQCQMSDTGSVSCVVEAIDGRKVTTICHLDVKSKTISSSGLEQEIRTPEIGVDGRGNCLSMAPNYSKSRLISSALSSYKSFLERSSCKGAVGQPINDSTETKENQLRDEDSSETPVKISDRLRTSPTSGVFSGLVFSETNKTTSLEGDLCPKAVVSHSAITRSEVKVNSVNRFVPPPPRRSKSPSLRSTLSSRGESSH